MIGGIVGLVAGQFRAVDQRHCDIAFPRQHKAIVFLKGFMEIADSASSFPVSEIAEPTDNFWDHGRQRMSRWIDAGMRMTPLGRLIADVSMFYL